MHIAIVKVENNRIVKFQEYKTKAEADEHVARVIDQFPDAFSAPLPAGGIPNLWVDGTTITVVPVTQSLEAQIAAIDEQLKVADERTLRTRGAREGDLLAYPVIALIKSTFSAPQLAALAQIEQALYASNPEYKKVKDEEAACIALRAQRKALLQS